MKTTRNIQQVFKSSPVLEGAGVHLKRVFGFSQLPMFDPFLLLDDFRSDNPEHYLKGFPWHPHRGIETITYVLEGDVAHGDSMGNTGDISAGDVQWMTAGSGIIHQEMPKGDKNGVMEGFQLWANLPADQKMMAPRYRDVKASTIPTVQLENGVTIKIICGKVGEAVGPVEDIVINPEYLDITVPPDTEFTHPTHNNHTVFAYIIGGQGHFFTSQQPETGKTGDTPGTENNSMFTNETLVLYEQGDEISLTTREESVRFLLISGKPIGEPVAWRGPIVMNTQEELQIAFDEYHNGTFVKDDG